MALCCETVLDRHAGPDLVLGISRWSTEHTTRISSDQRCPDAVSEFLSLTTLLYFTKFDTDATTTLRSLPVTPRQRLAERQGGDAGTTTSSQSTSFPQRLMKAGPNPIHKNTRQSNWKEPSSTLCRLTVIHGTTLASKMSRNAAVAVRR
jgi:hypothetical protein